MAVKVMKTILNLNRFSIPKPLQKPSIPTLEHTIVEQIRICSSLKELERVYATMIKTNAMQDCFLVNQFVSACTSFHCIDYAILAFTQMEEPNVFVYNAIIKCFVGCNQPIRALECYMHMLRAMVGPTSFTYTLLVKACGLVSALRFGEGVHGHIWKLGLESHTFVQTSLVDFYSNMGKIMESRKVFDEMPERDVYAWTTMVAALVRAGDLSSASRLFEEMPERNTAAWNTMIDGYARIRDVKSAESFFNQMPAKDIISWTTMINCYSQNKQFREALAVFDEMRANRFSPDEVTMSTIISACAHIGALDIGREIHLYVVQNGFDLDVYIGSALVDMYSKCGSLDSSLLVFFKLREKNLFCWNSIIEGLARHGYTEEALAMFSRMEREAVKPNGVTFISILGACAHAGLVEEGRKLFLSMMHDYLIPPEIEHYGCMVDLLSRAGLLEDALDLIRSMKLEPNSVIWCCLLGGCKLHKNLEIAKVAVKELMVLEPNNSGHYALLVNIHAEANRWSEVENIRQAMDQLGVGKSCPGSSWINGG
ncbi:hypothetical protein SLEP1_g14379 [Rubroshorea leprosula]|uniref:Chlororespiratory reduction 4 n=1 Tax=Rubroshorea leprosula TaxID=152421 RepID=A0AAV5IPP5_9ROSI|nr:hypothetical protein SLEP1_g14379 [Rubroshorea leprosula]